MILARFTIPDSDTCFSATGHCVPLAGTFLGLIHVWWPEYLSRNLRAIESRFLWFLVVPTLFCFGVAFGPLGKCCAKLHLALHYPRSTEYAVADFGNGFGSRLLLVPHVMRSTSSSYRNHHASH
jgi:hypothetical protein